MGEDSSPVRAALCQVIGSLMSPDIAERQMGEQQLEALQVTDEYGVHLTEITLHHEGPLPLRQMAGLLLKQYVDAHWSCEAEKFKEPEATPKAKAAVRAMLPLGLKESISKVRNSVAYCVSAIASWDWPEQWPELFEILTEALKAGAGNEFAVQGAVRVLKEFTRDLTDAQIPQVAPIILPDMYRIFMDPDTYGVRTRSRAIEIFTTLTNMVCTIGEVNRSLSKQLLGPILPTFTEALVAGLSLPDDSHASDPGLKTEILKALTILVRNVPKQMTPWMGQILPAVWATLTASAEKYVREVVNESEAEGGEGEDIVDSEGEVVGFENLVFAIFDYVHALVDNPKLEGAVKAGLTDLMFYVIVFMQMTDEQIEKWTENPDKFVEDEDEDSFTYSVRISSQDLWMALFETFEEECCAALPATLEKHLAQSEVMKNSGSASFWKPREAAMLALGTVHKSVEKRAAKRQLVNFDISAFLENVVMADIVNPASPFLLGRCMWLGSKFPSRLSQTAVTPDTPSSMGRFVEATVRGLQPDQIAVVRIAAVRAIWGFCSFLRLKKGNSAAVNGSPGGGDRRSLLLPVLPATVDALIDMCTSFNWSTEVLGLVLETLTMVLACDPAFTATVESKATPLAIAVFLEYSSDPVVASLVQDIFMVLAKTEGCLAPLEARLVPTLVSILDATATSSVAAGDHNSKDGTVSTGLKAVALDILQTVVRAAVVVNGGRSDCLSEVMMTRAFPAALHATTNTDDNSVVQSGGECLRAFMSVAPEQVCAYSDPEHGKTGLWYMVQVAGHLLNPVGSEFTASFVGRLITTLIQKAGIERLGTDLDALLKAVLSKLQGSETLSVIQSLVMVYAQLIHTQLNAVVNFLCSVPGPNGETALEFVLSQWVERQFLFFGAYETKVSIIALAKLLQHGVINNDTRLQDINVKGDLVESKARTRSEKRANPDQWTSIPVMVKILKLLLQELASNMDEVLDDGDESDEDSGAEDDSESEAVILSPESNAISAKVALKEVLDESTKYGLFDEDEDDEDDPDALTDPLYNVSLKKYLSQFVTEFAGQPFFQMHFALHLNPTERSTLHNIGISV